ncbi:MAG: hypothetical protein WC506_04465 [Candidatus Micrarchaeia archaeon]
MDSSFGKIPDRQNKPDSQATGKNIFAKSSEKLKQKAEEFAFASHISEGSYSTIAKRLEGKSVLFVMPSKEAKESFSQVNSRIIGSMGAVADYAVGPFIALDCAKKFTYDYIIGSTGHKLGMDFIRSALFLEYGIYSRVGELAPYPGTSSGDDFKKFYSAMVPELVKIRDASKRKKLKIEGLKYCDGYSYDALKYMEGGRILVVNRKEESLDFLDFVLSPIESSLGIRLDFADSDAAAADMLSKKSYSIVVSDTIISKVDRDRLGNEIMGSDKKYLASALTGFDLSSHVKESLSNYETAFFAVYATGSMKLRDNTGPGKLFDYSQELPIKPENLFTGLARSYVRHRLWLHGYFEATG